MSTDGGATWSTPIRVDQSAGDSPAFIPQVSTRSDGTVAVQYYDLENATAAQPDLTDQYLVTCSSDCSNPASWTGGGETRLSTSGPFDILTAPTTTAGAGFLGDYDGLVPTGSSFGSAFVMAQPIATPAAPTCSSTPHRRSSDSGCPRCIGGGPTLRGQWHSESCGCRSRPKRPLLLSDGIRRETHAARRGLVLSFVAMVRTLYLAAEVGDV